MEQKATENTSSQSCLNKKQIMQLIEFQNQFKIIYGSGGLDNPCLKSVSKGLSPRL